VGTARARAELGFQDHQSSAHPTSKSLVANGARSELTKLKVGRLEGLKAGRFESWKV
jgi:hypothetical protein